MLSAAVADLGRDSAMAAGKPSREAIRSYLDVVAWMPAGFGGPVLMRDTTDERKITAGVVAGLERTIVEVASNLPGGVKFTDMRAQQEFERFDLPRELQRLGRFKHDLESTFHDNIRILFS